jgi:peptidoglycan hydrolase-like protein with peptidoglycan-binding domain
MLRLGSRGPEVAAMQRALGISADGIFGHQTKRAVKAFQAAHGLEVDGIVGPITRGALGAAGGGGVRSKLPPATTIAVQRALGISADGVFGPPDAAGGQGLPGAHGLEVDGVVGPVTLGALGISGSVAPVGGGGAAGAVAAARTQAASRTRSAASARTRSTAPASPSGRWPRSGSRSRARASSRRASACTSTARRSRPATSCSSTPTARARRTSASPPPDDRDLRHQPRRARALDGRRLLGRPLLRRAPRGVSRPAIEVSGLVKAFGDFRALDGLDLEVATGEVHGFLGPTGRASRRRSACCSGCCARAAGEVRMLGGDPWADAVALHRRLAYVPATSTCGRS